MKEGKEPQSVCGHGEIGRHKKQYISSLKDKLIPYPWTGIQTVSPELSGTHPRTIIARVGSRVGKQMSQRPYWPLSSFYFQRRGSEKQMENP